MNSNPHNLPLVTRDAPVSVTPVIPLNFVYPGLSLSQILSIVRAYAKLSVLIFLIGLGATALGMTFLPRTYTAMVTLMVNYEVNDPLNGKELPIGQVSNYIATQVGLMQTPDVLLAVVDRLALTDNEDYSRGYKGDVGTLREWVAKKLTKNLAVYQGQQGSQLIYVTYSANDPSEAAQIANAVADIYKEQDYTRSSGPPVERTKRYAAQLNELKNNVDQAQQKLTSFYQRNGLIDEGKIKVDVELLAALESRLLDVQTARRAAEARTLGDESVNDQVLSSGLVQSLKTQLATQEARLAQLSAHYTSRHPEIPELKSQIRSTRRSLASAMQSYSANATAGLKTAQRIEENLKQAVAEQRALVLAKSRLRDEAAKHLVVLESAQTVYKRALEAYDQIMFVYDSNYTNVSFINRAMPPVKPSKPKILTGFALGGIAAGMLALGIPLAYELFNRRVRCRDDIERQYGIPVLVEFGALRMRAAV